MSFVYLLQSSDGATYVGATMNLERRLRQHNKELVGGARATSRKVKKGQVWTRVCYVEGFPDWVSALQFEWAWKYQSRKLSTSMVPIERRKQALDNLVKLEKPTSKSIPYSKWEDPIHIVWEKENENIHSV